MSDSPITNHSEPLARTFRVLAATQHEAATPVLLAALDSPRRAIQLAALECLLERGDASGHRAIVARLRDADPDWLGIVAARPGRLSAALADGLSSSDAAFVGQACEAIRALREFDLIPALVAALVDDADQSINHRSALLGTTLLELIDALCEALSELTPGQSSLNALASAARAAKHPALASLAAATRSFSAHERTPIVEAFLRLAERDNVTLRQILHDEQHDAFDAVVDTLQHDAHPAVVRLLLSLLDDPHPPSSALTVISRRSDREFAFALLHSASPKLPPAAAGNLRSIRSLAWLPLATADLDVLNETQQAALVAVLAASAVDRAEVWQVVEHCCTHGQPLARVAAVGALAEFQSPGADVLAFRAVDDADPRVQAAALPQIRPRGMPGAIARLISLTDSPHECISEAVREGLAEFSFHQYVATLEMLDDESRRTTGRLVRKINPQCVSILADELQVPSRQRRLRALSIAMAMGVVGELETAVAGLLADRDPTIRTQAVFALAQCSTSTARSAVSKALSDESLAVRQAAQQVLITLEPSNRRDGCATVENCP